MCIKNTIKIICCLILLSFVAHAKSTFLPDLTDSEVGFSSSKTDNNYNRGDNCSGYELTSCPANGNCSSCPFNQKHKKLVSCNHGYTQSGNSCSASSCSAIGYETDIPTNQICTKVTESGLICYKDCRTVSCSGYTLNCDNFNVANSAGKATCPDCESASANCSLKLCKVSSCLDGFKIADNGTECVALDDTCENGYYKSCDTGTTGEPKYTEAGTACWQCKAKTISTDLPILYSDLTASNIYDSSKTPIGVVFNESKKLAVALETITGVWATEYFNIPNLSDYSTAVMEWEGKNNTQTIINYCSANNKSCPAAEYTYTYSTKGTKAGDWYLPALGELNSLYSQKVALKSVLTTLGADDVSNSLSADWHRSSTEYNTQIAWCLNFSNGETTRPSKTTNTNYYIHPIINYGDIKTTCTPLKDDSECADWRQYPCSDSCGGQRKCCGHYGYRYASCTSWTAMCKQSEVQEAKDSCKVTWVDSCDIVGKDDPSCDETEYYNCLDNVEFNICFEVLPDSAADFIYTAPEGCLK